MISYFKYAILAIFNMHDKKLTSSDKKPSFT